MLTSSKTSKGYEKEEMNEYFYHNQLNIKRIA